jgi:hypothetical protein
VFEEMSWWHLWLSILYVWAILWSGNKLGWINFTLKNTGDRIKEIE